MEIKFLLIPMFLQYLLTMIVLYISRKRRVVAVKKGEVSATYFKTNEGSPPPREVQAADQIFLNL